MKARICSLFILTNASIVGFSHAMRRVNHKLIRAKVQFLRFAHASSLQERSLGRTKNHIHSVALSKAPGFGAKKSSLGKLFPGGGSSSASMFEDHTKKTGSFKAAYRIFCCKCKKQRRKIGRTAQFFDRCPELGV